MPDDITFSEQQQQRFAEIKDILRRRLRAVEADSEAVYECALLFVEVRDQKYHRIDNVQQCGEWMHKIFEVGPHQANKYFRVAERLTREEVRGKRLGIEVLYQIALAPESLRAQMWELAERQRFSGGALSAGRLAAVPYARKGQNRRAAKALNTRATAQAVKEAQEEAERKARQQRTPGQRIVEGLLREAERLEKLLEEGVVPSQEEAMLIRSALDSLIKLGEQLPRTFETSGNGKANGSQEAGGKFVDSPVPPATPVVSSEQEIRTEEKAAAEKQTAPKKNPIGPTPSEPEFRTGPANSTNPPKPAEPAPQYDPLAPGRTKLGIYPWLKPAHRDP